MRNQHTSNTPTFSLSIPAKTNPNPNLNRFITSTLKPISTLEQAFEVMRIFQNGPTLQKCPHFTSRVMILLFITDSHTQNSWRGHTRGRREVGGMSSDSHLDCRHARRALRDFPKSDRDNWALHSQCIFFPFLFFTFSLLFRLQFFPSLMLFPSRRPCLFANFTDLYTTREEKCEYVCANIVRV